MERLTSMENRPVVPGYRIGRLIARGSSAAVWSATAVDADRDLAVKVIPVGAGDDGGRIAGELSALAVSRGGDDHLVTVLDVVPVSDPGPAVAIVMDRLRHGTLTRLVSTRGHLTPGEVVTVLTPVALTVAGLHDAAVVHGDLSPSNVGFDGRGRPVVLDLGVSMVVGTRREEIYGTPGFVAPEVVAGGAPTPSSDVYAMGALGWYALMGEPPPMPAERLSLAAATPPVPDTMCAALERALHPDPAERGDARDLATEVYASVTAVPIEPGEGTDEATMLTHRVRELARSRSGDGDEPARRTRRSRRAELRTRSRRAHLRILTSVVAALVIGAGGVAVASVGRGSEPPSLAPKASLSTTAPDAAGAAGAPLDHAAVVAGLVQARAQAWTARDPDALTACFTPQSAALASDAALLAHAGRAGHRYEGLGFAVSGVRLLAESQDRFRLEADIATSAYAVRTDAVDTPVAREPTSTRVHLTVDLTDSGWRISEVDPVPG